MPSPYLGEDLIFLISQPRSGSTLMQRVLSGHPDIQTSAETWLMLNPAYSLRESGVTAEYGAKWRKEAVEEFLGNYTSGREIYDDAIRAYAQTVYGNALSRAGKKHFLDKTPRYFFIIPDLYRLFPKAKFIFLLRNPMAVLASELDTYVKGDWKILGWFGPDLVSAPRWILDGIELLGADAITVRYESFVETPESETQRLCSYLGIDFHETMVEYTNTPAPKGKMNDPTGVHQHSRPQTSSVNSWKRLADDPQSNAFAHGYLNDLGDELMEQFGYDAAAIRSALGPAPDPDDTSLYPWSLALKDANQWSICERYRHEQYEAVKRHGKNLTARLGAMRRMLQWAKKSVSSNWR